MHKTKISSCISWRKEGFQITFEDFYQHEARKSKKLTCLSKIKQVSHLLPNQDLLLHKAGFQLTFEDFYQPKARNI